MVAGRLRRRANAQRAVRAGGRAGAPGDCSSRRAWSAAGLHADAGARRQVSIQGLAGREYLDNLADKKRCKEAVPEVRFAGEVDRVYLDVPGPLRVRAAPVTRAALRAPAAQAAAASQRPRPQRKRPWRAWHAAGPAQLRAPAGREPLPAAATLSPRSQPDRAPADRRRAREAHDRGGARGPARRGGVEPMGRQGGRHGRLCGRGVPGAARRARLPGACAPPALCQGHARLQDSASAAACGGEGAGVLGPSWPRSWPRERMHAPRWRALRAAAARRPGDRLLTLCRPCGSAL